MAKRKPRRAKAARKATAAKKSTRRAARKATARRAKTKTSSRSARRPSARKTTRKATRKTTRQLTARNAAARKTAKKKVAKKKVAKKKVATRTAAATPVAKKAATPRAARTAPPRPKRAPTLDRARKTVTPIRDETEPHGLPSSLDVDRTPSAARSGRKELHEKLRAHTSTSPSITAGDVDADWEAAESVGDEAPGGDNPTPDQDRVDDIGRALGVEYDDEEELKGGDEIAARDRHRWELDPGSSDDYDDRD